MIFLYKNAMQRSNPTTNGNFQITRHYSPLDVRERSAQRLRSLLSPNQLLTSSKMSSFSSNCRSSCRLRLWGLPGCGLPAPGVLPGPCSTLPVRNVRLPSTVLRIGFRRPPRSNSWAEIFRTGVVAPEPLREGGWCVGDANSIDEEVGVAWDTNQESTTCRVAFLQKKNNRWKNGREARNLFVICFQ